MPSKSAKAKKTTPAKKPAPAKANKAANKPKAADAAPRVDFSRPKERAVLDVIALAMSADEVVTAEEMDLAVAQLQSILGLPRADPVLRQELKNVIVASVTAIHAEGRERILDRALTQIDTDDERRMLFALAASMTCADGTVHPAEAKFLSLLRLGLGLTEAEAIQGVAGVATLMAARRTP